MTAVDDRPSPVLTVTRGRPTTAEVAAVVAVLLALETAGAAAASAAPAAPARPSAWAHRSRGWRPLPPPGPGSWRASAQPY